MIEILKEAFAPLLAVASFILSGFALWTAQFRHGRLIMTQPTLLCVKREIPHNTPKIFLRTLLFATGPKGRAVEAMFLKVRSRIYAGYVERDPKSPRR
jgi:hypothetical protein